MAEHDSPSAADDFGPARLIITLPVPGPKGALRVEVEAASLEELVPILKGLPGAGRDESDGGRGDPLELTLNFLTEYGEKARAIVERWCIAPRISFDGEKAGHVQWVSLHLMNRLAIVNGITRFSQTGSAGEAERLATFPPEQPSGLGNGRGAAGAGKARNAAAPVLPQARAHERA